MPDPLSLKQIRNNLKNNPNNGASQRNQFRQIERIDTYQVLERTIVSTGCGMKMDEDFPEAVKNSGGLVLRKYSEQLGKYEIVAIIFKDAMMVKNDPDWIAQQDFSFFGSDAEKIKKKTIQEALQSKEGIHYFAQKTGIPVLVDKKGKLIFLSGDEIKTGTGTEYTFEKSSVGLDPQTRKEFEDGARALRENDPAALERLKRAGGAHLMTREKSIAATSDFSLLDARTGGEIGIAASNAQLGRDLSFTRDNIFVPESVLINRFIQDSQRQDPSITGRAAWEVFYILPKRGDDEGEGRFGMKVYSVCRFGAMTQDAALSYDADIGKQQKPIEATVMSQTAIFDAISHKSITGKILPKSLLPAHPQAMLFDGFSPGTGTKRIKTKEEVPEFQKGVGNKRERKAEENVMLRKPKRMRTWFNERLIAPKSEPIMKEQIRKIGDKKEKKKEKKAIPQEKKPEKRKAKPDDRMPPAFGKKNRKRKPGDKREKPPFAHSEKVTRKGAKPSKLPAFEKKKERKSNRPESNEKKQKAKTKIREEKFEKKKEQKTRQRERIKEEKKEIVLNQKRKTENPLFKAYVFEALTSRKTRAGSSSGRKRQSGP